MDVDVDVVDVEEVVEEDVDVVVVDQGILSFQ